MDEKLYLIDLDCYARAEENQKKRVKESHCFDFGLLPTKGLGAYICKECEILPEDEPPDHRR